MLRLAELADWADQAMSESDGFGRTVLGGDEPSYHGMSTMFG